MRRQPGYSSIRRSAMPRAAACAHTLCCFTRALFIYAHAAPLRSRRHYVIRALLLFTLLIIEQRVCAPCLSRADARCHAAAAAGLCRDIATASATSVVSRAEVRFEARLLPAPYATQPRDALPRRHAQCCRFTAAEPHSCLPLPPCLLRHVFAAARDERQFAATDIFLRFELRIRHVDTVIDKAACLRCQLRCQRQLRYADMNISKLTPLIFAACCYAKRGVSPPAAIICVSRCLVTLRRHTGTFSAMLFAKQRCRLLFFSDCYACGFAYAMPPADALRYGCLRAPLFSCRAFV